MKYFLIITFCLIIAGNDAVTTVTGYRGRSVQIKCSYTSGYEKSTKYLCRGRCSVVLIKDIPVDSKSPAKDSRFSLYDDTTAKVFTVTITDLRPEDEGTYWCAIEETWHDIYTEILLLVKMDDPDITTHPTSTQARSPLVHDVVGVDFYAVIGASAVLLLLFAVAVIIAIYCKTKCHGFGAVTHPFRETVEDSENDQSVLLPYQAREIDNLSESVYQNINPATRQSISMYQNLIFTHNQPVSAYQSLTFTYNQSDLTYHNLIYNNNQSDSEYQSLIFDNNQLDSFYQSLTSTNN